MALRYTIEESSNPLMIHMSGGLTLGPQLAPFGRQVAALIAARRPSAVLLDCGEVEEVDSAGLGELVILYTAAGQHHCRLVLVSPSIRLRRLLETTRLSGLLPQFADAKAAQAWVQRP